MLVYWLYAEEKHISEIFVTRGIEEPEKNPQIKLRDDPAIPLLGICSKELKSVCQQIFALPCTTALFIIAV